MAATRYSLRYLAQSNLDDVMRVGENEVGPIQSPLEKFARGMRYAQSTVSYYSPKYDYRKVSTERNIEAEKLFDQNSLSN